MKKPLGIVYGLSDVPPLTVTLLNGLQHVGLMSIFFVIPLTVIREARLSPQTTVDLLSVSMLAMSVSAILPALHRGPVGAGFLCPAVFTAAYLSPSLLAVRAGGLALVCGMTIFAGGVEVVLARFQRRLRPYFPPEIAGFVVAMIGLSIGAIGIRYVLGVGAAAPAGPRDLAVSALTLGAMVALNVWGKGFLKFFCALLGMLAGYGAAVALGVLTRTDFDRVVAVRLFSVPSFGHVGWSFDTAMVFPFTVAAVAACLKAIGNVVACQKITDADWVRPDTASIGRGVLADGLGTVTAGLLGTVGTNSSSSAVGLVSATGITSRRVAYAIAAIFLLLAFMPQAVSVLAIMPRSVMGAALLFAFSFIFINGLQIMTSRMLDVRRTFVIALSFIAGLGVDFYPAFFRGLPEFAQPFVGTSLVLGTLSALALNVVFRLGVRKTQTLRIEPRGIDAPSLHDFMEAQGTTWGARRDVIDRATFCLAQSIETIVDSCQPAAPMDVTASFDEFNLDLRVSYEGAVLELPDKRPTNEEVMASEEGQRRLAGFMLRRYADRVAATHRDGRSTILFHFDH